MVVGWNVLSALACTSADYLSGPENLNLLGSVNLAMGYPPFCSHRMGILVNY
jgi:hypothetical protein